MQTKKDNTNWQYFILLNLTQSFCKILDLHKSDL